MSDTGVTSANSEDFSLSSSTSPVDTQMKGGSASSSTATSGGSVESFKSLGDMQKQSPELYKAFMQGAASTMISEAQASQKRLIEAMKKARSEEG